MSIVLTILGIIACIIALLLVAAVFMKKEYSVEREIVINKPKRDTFDYIRILKNQDHYNKWWSMDPNAKKEFTGTDGTVGFIAAWDSQHKQVGKGEQEIKRINDGESIDTEIRFVRPFEGVADVYMAATAVNNDQTKVRWTFNGKNKYPMNLMNSVIGKMLGKDLEISIINLKAAIEKNQAR